MTGRKETMELENYINVIDGNTEVIVCDKDSIIIYHGRLKDLSGCVLNRIVVYIGLVMWHITGNIIMRIDIE